MFDVEGKWPNKVEQTGSILGLSEIRTADTPPVHDIIHRQGASFSPLIHSQCQFFSNTYKMTRLTNRQTDIQSGLMFGKRLVLWIWWPCTMWPLLSLTFSLYGCQGKTRALYIWWNKLAASKLLFPPKELCRSNFQFAIKPIVCVKPILPSLSIQAPSQRTTTIFQAERIGERKRKKKRNRLSDVENT